MCDMPARCVDQRGLVYAAPLAGARCLCACCAYSQTMVAVFDTIHTCHFHGIMVSLKAPRGSYLLFPICVGACHLLLGWGLFPGGACSRVRMLLLRPPFVCARFGRLLGALLSAVCWQVCFPEAFWRPGFLTLKRYLQPCSCVVLGSWFLL